MPKIDEEVTFLKMVRYVLAYEFTEFVIDLKEFNFEEVELTMQE